MIMIKWSTAPLVTPLDVSKWLSPGGTAGTGWDSRHWVRQEAMGGQQELGGQQALGGNLGTDPLKSDL